MSNAQCQDCQNTKSPPVGMFYWPTDEDDYICIVCLRERFRKLEAENAKLSEQLSNSIEDPGLCEEEFADLLDVEFPRQSGGE